MKDYLPPAIKNRTDKKGFVTPGEVRWLRGSMKHMLDINYKQLDFLDKKVVMEEIDRFKKGDNTNANLIWRIASVNYWMTHQV